jgi:mycofactocin precursor
MSAQAKPITPEHDTDAHQDTEPLVDADTLIEEVSIDGMCGVY